MFEEECRYEPEEACETVLKEVCEPHSEEINIQDIKRYKIQEICRNEPVEECRDEVTGQDCHTAEECHIETVDDEADAYGIEPTEQEPMIEVLQGYLSEQKIE